MGVPRVDHRADIYAVGVILHELVTGVRGGHNHNVFRARHDVSGLLAAMLALDPRFRPATCAHAVPPRVVTDMAEVTEQHTDGANRVVPQSASASCSFARYG